MAADTNPSQINRSEINRLQELVPGSGRMVVKVVDAPEAPQTITSEFPYPWRRNRAIAIDFDRWLQLPESQRDLLFLREVCWLTRMQWFEPQWQQGVALLAAVVMTFELAQGDGVGAIAAGALAGCAGWQWWQQRRSPERQVDADRGAISVAQRRGYDTVAAATALLAGIEAIAILDGNSGLSFTDQVRCQNLRGILNPLRSPSS
ncbi:MAG: DUF3318 domain-containing protein [Cyanobacteria bacterium P01_F01_bin.153]